MQGKRRSFWGFAKSGSGLICSRNRNTASESTARMEQRYLSGSGIAKPYDAHPAPIQSNFTTSSRNKERQQLPHSVSATDSDSAIEGYIDPAGPNKNN
jgi:hypothetical protein